MLFVLHCLNRVGVKVRAGGESVCGVSLIVSWLDWNQGVLPTTLAVNLISPSLGVLIERVGVITLVLHKQQSENTL